MSGNVWSQNFQYFLFVIQYCFRTSKIVVSWCQVEQNSWTLSKRWKDKDGHNEVFFLQNWTFHKKEEEGLYNFDYTYIHHPPKFTTPFSKLRNHHPPCRVRKSKNFPVSKIFHTKTFRIKRVNRKTFAFATKVRKTREFHVFLANVHNGELYGACFIW